jgi:hypothetical protein
MGRQVYLTRLALVRRLNADQLLILIIYRAVQHMSTLKTRSTSMLQGQENGRLH